MARTRRDKIMADGKIYASAGFVGRWITGLGDRFSNLSLADA